MPVVPYRPYPDQAPRDIPTPSVRISTPGEAFGIGVGHAISQLGQTGEQVGNELFTRAIALQQLQNESDARKANADYIIQAGQLHNDFITKRGIDAGPDALRAHSDQMNALREQIRSSLPNAQSQKMYDSEAIGFMARNIFNASGHSANEVKQHQNDVSALEDKAAGIELAQNPFNENAVEAVRARLERNSYTRAGLEGWSEDERKDHFRDAFADALGKMLVSGAKTDPFTAREWADKYHDELAGRAQQVVNTVTDRSRETIARNISHHVNGDLLTGDPHADEEPLEGRMRRGLDEAKKQFPNDTELSDHVEQRVRIDYDNFKRAKKEAEDHHLDVISDAITSGVKNLDELRANDSWSAAYDALPPKKKLAIPGMIDRYRNAAMKSTQEETWFRLRGMAEENPSAFLDVDPTKEQLSQKDARQVFSMQQKLRKESGKDPQVQRALGILQRDGQLNGANIDKQRDPDRYYTFVGAVADAVQSITQKNKAPPTYEEVREIGKTLLYDLNARGHWWQSSDRFFEHARNLPQKDVDAIREKIMKDNPTVYPSDEDIVREYARQRFMEAYKSRSGTAQSPQSR